MPVPRIVRGQRVETTKVELAKALRRELTPEECRLWERLRRSQLDGFHFRRQQVVHGFIADFYCHAAALIVELDGEIHRDREKYDGDRDGILKSHGFLTLRFENVVVRQNIDEVLKSIAQVCVERVGSNERGK